MRIEIVRPCGIMFNTNLMRFAIQLDHEGMFVTIKVRNERTDRELAAEF